MKSNNKIAHAVMFATDDEKSLIFRRSLATGKSLGKGSSTIVHPVMGLPLSTPSGYKRGDRKQMQDMLGKC